MRIPQKKYHRIPPLLSQQRVVVSKRHTLHAELRGEKNGVPAVFLHGGPGGECSERHTRFFCSKYCTLFHDQRGGGKSTPLGELQENTTEHLVADIVQLMDQIGFEKAVFFGTSWGTTLALCFAIAHPERVQHLVLSGTFLGTKEENEYLLRQVGRFVPETWDAYMQHIPNGQDHLDYSIQKILGKNTHEALAYARRLLSNEYAAMSWFSQPAKIAQVTNEDAYTLAARIWALYVKHDCFLPAHYILDHVHAISHIPIDIIMARQDLVCPPESGYRLSQKHGNTRLHSVPGGHSTRDPFVKSKIISILDTLAQRYYRQRHKMYKQ